MPGTIPIVTNILCLAQLWVQLKPRRLIWLHPFSPPNEHRLLLGRPWYERYHPVSYQLTSRSGTRQEFIQMLQIWARPRGS
jgi:hypothetical protein